MNFSLVPWGRIGLIAGALAGIALLTAWKIEERRADKLQAQVIKWQREFARISNERNVQKVITRDRIIEVERKAKDADSRAKRIEAAPLPGNCKTPEAVRSADL